MRTFYSSFQKLCRNYFWLALTLLSGPLFSQEAFLHQATTANTRGHVTTIGHAAVDNNPNAIIFATHDYGKNGPYYPHEFGVYYSSGKWRLFSQGRAAIPANSRFNILVIKAGDNAFVHTVTTANTSGHATTLSHPLLNNNPGAVVIITQNWGTLGPYNPHHGAVRYDAGKKRWIIFNQDHAVLPRQAKFNVLVLPPEKRFKINKGFMVGLKIQAASVNNHIALLKHAVLDKQPGRSLFVTQHWGDQGPYNNHPVGVWYNAKQWAVYNENLKAMPKEAKFHVLSIEHQDASTLAVIPSMHLYLDRIIYPEGSPVRAELHFDQPPPGTALANPGLLLTSSQSKDVEYIQLIPTEKPGVFKTRGAIPTRTALAPAAATALDGTLSLRPGEMFYAMYSPRGRAEDFGSVEGTDLIYDIGVAAERAGNSSRVRIIPELALTQDENSPQPGQRPMTTMTTRGSIPIQVALDELLIHPLNRPQLDRFLAKTQGAIIDQYIPVPNEPYGLQSAYLVKVNLESIDGTALAQLRAALGLTDTLFVSKPAALKLVQVAIESLLDGYAVELNPRLIEMSDRYGYTAAETTSKNMVLAEPTFSTENLSASFFNRADNLFDIPRVWAFMALWDKDQSRIPVAFLDQGFSPNRDFRRPFFAECNLEGPDRCSPGAATSPPTVGNSFFGQRSWHGNGVVSVAGGVINNGFGVGGTGGQVVLPGLYRFGLSAYALEVGQGTRRAVSDGATVINISAGYPCRLLTNILGWTPGICGTADRGLFCTTVTLGLATANAVICSQAALLAALPFPFDLIFGGPAAFACGASTVALATASTACYTTLIAGDVRGVMEDGVAFALSQGVTVVSIAGNKFTREDLPPVIRDIINLDPRRQTVEEWQPIPGSIPGVICVGATFNFSPFANSHVFGSRVDIWAPMESNYTAPRSRDNVSDIDSLWSLGGTSAAAPYISGLIANIQAIDPSLNPRTPGLSTAARRAIPGRIRTLLVGTAFTNTELLALRVSNPDNERGNLINPMRLITTVGRNVIPVFAARGYDNTLNFGGAERSPDDDTRGRAQVISASRDSLLTGTIITFPGDMGAASIIDQDWYVWRTPNRPGIFRNGLVELTFPTAFGDLRINEDREAPVLVSITGDETTKRYVLPNLMGNAEFAVQVSGDRRGSDNVYKLRFQAATRDLRVLVPDRFDRIRGNNNPASPHDNNTSAGATLLGTAGLNWQSGTGYSPLLFPILPAPGYEIAVPDLNFHNITDADWFSISELPSRAGRGSCVPAMIRIKANTGVQIELFNEHGLLLMREIGEITTSMQFQHSPSRPATFVHYFRLSPVSPGSVVSYNLSVIYEWPSIEFCRPFGGIALSSKMRTPIEPESIPDLIVYPNPTRDMVTIKLLGRQPDPDQSTRIVIYNPKGSAIMNHEFRNGELQVDFSTYPKGFYHIRLILDGKEQVVKKLLNY